MEIQSVWSILLQLYGQMDGGASMNEIAGGNLSPVEGIEKELQSANPDWGKVTLDLDQLESTCNEMVAIAEENHLRPVSDPNFIELLQNTSATIETLKSQVGTPEFSLNGLLNELCDIKQDILQG